MEERSDGDMGRKFGEETNCEVLEEPSLHDVSSGLWEDTPLLLGNLAVLHVLFAV